MAVNTSGLDALIAGLEGAVDRGVFRAAGYVKTLAVDLAPEDSGDLKKSGHLEPSAATGGGSYRVVFDVPYATYVEHGNDNPNYPAQPYLTPAVKEIDVRAEVKAEVAALIGGARQ
jgi:hypothetical protein